MANVATAPTTTGPMLEARGLHAGYGAVPVLRGVNLRVAPGEILLLIGRNGSGKSTTLKAIAGLLKLDRGSITLEGQEISGTSRRERMIAGIGLVPQAGNHGRGIFPHLTVRENLELMADLSGHADTAAACATAWRLFPELKELGRRRGTTLSGGQQQMLAVALAIVARPRLLLLDEPTCGLARGRAVNLMAVIRRLAEEDGVGCVLVEQNVSLVLGSVDAVCAMRSGEIVARTTPERASDPDWLSTVL